MKVIEAARLRQALEKTGNAWLFEFWGDDAEKALERMRRSLARFIREYRRRYPDEAKPDPFRLLEVNSAKGAAFFQADIFEVSIEMQILAWRILTGCTVVRVEFTYALGSDAHLRITLRSLSGDDEVFPGRGPSDHLVLRHFGSFILDGRLRLDGYYGASQPDNLPA
jgi:hypothetical protein